MLTAHSISKQYQTNPVLKDITFSILPGDRIGLIGPNGSGKTTLLRILAGQEGPDQGYIVTNPKSLAVGYLSQGFEIDPRQTMEQVLEQVTGNRVQLESELASLAEALARQPDREDLQSRYDLILRQIENNNSLELSRIESILESLELAHISPDQVVGTLSGGQKTRLSLALVMVKNPSLLLLDEPTNHLDIEMLEWMEAWLVEFASQPGRAFLQVSHDRTFLDRTVSRVLDLNPETHGLREFTGNYSTYLEQYLAEQDLLMSRYRDQVYEIRRMKEDIHRTKQQSLRVELTTTPRQPGVRRIAKKVARKAKSREKKLERYISSDERLEKPKSGWQMKLEFAHPEHVGKDVLVMSDLAVGYPGSPPLLSGLNLAIRSGERIVLTGPNGSGKTSLLRTIAGHLQPAGGLLRLGASARLGFMDQEQALLNPEWSALQVLQHDLQASETDLRSFLHFFLFTGDDVLRPAAELSYGERARLSLASLVAQGCNFLLLDEPINHLDIPSRERFEQALANFDGTVLAVVHDRYFIERFATSVWLVEGQTIRY